MDADDIKLVLVEIKTTEALADKLKGSTQSLEAALSSSSGIDVVPASASGLKAVDPLTFSVLLAVAAKSAAGAAAALAAKDLYAWLRQQAVELLKEDRPTHVTVSVGGREGVAVSFSEGDAVSAEKAIETALEKDVSPAKPKD